MGEQDGAMSQALRDEPMGRKSSPIREITIRPLDYGFIIHVGCQQLAIESKEVLFDKLKEYFTNPMDTENKYYNQELLKQQKNYK